MDVTLLGIFLAAAMAAVAGALALQARSLRHRLDVEEVSAADTSGDLHWSREIDPVVVVVLFALVGLALTAIVIAIRLV